MVFLLARSRPVVEQYLGTERLAVLGNAQLRLSFGTV